MSMQVSGIRGLVVLLEGMREGIVGVPRIGIAEFPLPS